ncbi:hypothetical protein [Hymenobacter siberiensis]|uniref:hypothetical protein n=1 Tax=Hymenobacter siberiensis TaxID=2848396 RepID=UPI001C1E6C1B|nr:hypothetical protein [Hymenobacter siberiensis]MBU6120797.1 hypothetical protein [Hymenobacter siberiensis]
MSKPPFSPRLLLAPLLLAAACEHPKTAVITSSPASIEQLEGTWLAAHEENHGDTLVYRPNTHKFPPTRGRTGFAIRPYGRFEQFDIAPTDGLIGRPGTWTADGDTRLRIHLTEGQQPDYTFEILSLDKKVLELRRVN